MADTIAVIVTKPPYGTEEAFAGMRQALAMLVSGLTSRSVVMMVGEGTMNALANQDPQALSMPSNMEAVEDLIALDGEVYVVSEDLDALFSDPQLIEGVQRINWSKAKEILAEIDLINTF